MPRSESHFMFCRMLCRGRRALAAGLLAFLPAAAFASGESVPLNSFDIPAGKTVTLTFRVTVDSPLGTCTDAVSNQGTYSGSNFASFMTDDPDVGGMTDPTVTGLDVIDLAVTKTNGTATTAPGAGTTYTIVVSNAGPSNAVAATVVDNFPAALTGVTWTCVPSGGSSCPAAGAGNINAMVNVGAGENVTFTAMGTVDAGASGSLSNTATVTAAPNQTECDTGDNSATDTDTLTPQADLAVTKDDGATSVVAGETTTYVITAGNPSGPSDVTATVADVFPAEIADVSWTCSGSGGGICPASGMGDLNEAVTLPVGGSVTFMAVATVDPGASGTLVNTATVTVTGGGTDPNGANDSATDDDTVIEREADLAVTKTDAEDPPAPGNNVVYTIEVENLGPSSATGVVVTDNLPAGLTLVSTTGCAEDPNGTPTCTLGTIAAGATASYTIEASVDDPPPASVTNTATAAGNETDPNPANDSDDETTTFDASAPEVTTVDSAADTGDGALDECETALVDISQVLVTFSEDVQDGSPADAASATNPANYRLLRPASSGEDFDTVTCGGGTGDDLVTPIASVAYDDGTMTATLNLAEPLGAGLYRLFVCGTIEDEAGNGLDGGAGSGSDFTRTFRADPNNLFADGHFDDFDGTACTPLDSWPSSMPANVELADDDVDGSPLSGSAANAPAAPAFDLGQCTTVPADELLRLRGRLRVTSAGVLVNTQVVCDFFSGAACGGSNLGSQAFFQSVGDTGGDWLRLRYLLLSPPGTASALCGFALAPGTGTDLDAHLDDLFLGEATVFADGFESGDTSAWTVTVP